MRKSIFPIFAILASSLIPMSANADLSNTFNERKTRIALPCVKFYEYSYIAYKGRNASIHKCVKSSGRIFDYDIETSTTSTFRGVLGETSTETSTFHPGFKRYFHRVTQFKMEGDNLVRYYCDDADQWDSSSCKTEIKRRVYYPYTK
jgi:hypothetical protein